MMGKKARKSDSESVEERLAKLEHAVTQLGTALLLMAAAQKQPTGDQPTNGAAALLNQHQQ